MAARIYDFKRSRITSPGMDVNEMRLQCERRLEGLRTDRYSWWVSWRDLADYMMPRRYRWLVTPNQMNRGSPMNQRIINETGSIALRVCGAGMMAGITSPGRPWFRQTLDDPELAEYWPVKMWLAEKTKRILTVMGESNYYNSLATMYPDLALFGTAPTIMDEDFEDVVRMYNPCAGEYFLANSGRLEVDTLYREFTLTVCQIVEKFGFENCSDDVRQSIQTGGAALTREKVVCQAIEPNSEYLPKVKDLRGMPYRSIYWERGVPGDRVLQLRGAHECPFQAPRWDTVANDAYGRSPGMDALPAVRQLQLEEIRKAQGIDKMVNPPMVGDVSMKNQPASMIPGGVTYADLKNSNPGFKPAYEVKPDLQYMVMDIQGIELRIKSILYYDLWLMISQLDTVRTATEIDARREEKLIQLGPVLERFQNEKLDKDISRIDAIMTRGGLMPKAPPELKGQTPKSEYVSMLATAQKAVMTAGVERFSAFVGNIAAVRPDVLDNVDWDEMTDEYADMLGISPKVIKPFAEVVKLRAQRQQQAAEEKMMAVTAAGVQGAKTLSETQLGGGINALQAMVGA